MIAEKIFLANEYPALAKTQNKPILETYCRDAIDVLANTTYPAMIICPGGAYLHLSPREGEPVALALLAGGIQCFVLKYSVSPDNFPCQLQQVAAAFAYIRDNAERYAVDPNAIGVCGFSAGGHLAGSYGTLWQEDALFEDLGIPAEKRRPNGLGLLYAVLTSGKKAHRGSFHNLLGENETPELLEKLSVEKQVSPSTPPTFLFHTAADGSVPVENSLLMAQALSKYRIPFELHIAPYGGHGLAMCDWLSSVKFTPESVPAYANRYVEEFIDWFLRTTGYNKIAG